MRWITSPSRIRVTTATVAPLLIYPRLLPVRWNAPDIPLPKYGNTQERMTAAQSQTVLTNPVQSAAAPTPQSIPPPTLLSSLPPQNTHRLSSCASHLQILSQSCCCPQWFPLGVLSAPATLRVWSLWTQRPALSYWTTSWPGSTTTSTRRTTQRAWLSSPPRPPPKPTPPPTPTPKPRAGTPVMGAPPRSGSPWRASRRWHHSVLQIQRMREGSGADRRSGKTELGGNRDRTRGVRLTCRWAKRAHTGAPTPTAETVPHTLPQPLTEPWSRSCSCRGARRQRSGRSRSTWCEQTEDWAKRRTRRKRKVVSADVGAYTVCIILYPERRRSSSDFVRKDVICSFILFKCFLSALKKNILQDEKSNYISRKATEITTHKMLQLFYFLFIPFFAFCAGCFTLFRVKFRCWNPNLPQSHTWVTPRPKQKPLQSSRSSKPDPSWNLEACFSVLYNQRA